MIQDDYESDKGPIYTLKLQDKTLNSFLQALKQRKSKGFVTTPADSKNPRSKLQTVHFSSSITQGTLKRTDWILGHAKMHRLDHGAH